MACSVPVLLLAFNRPEQTRQVLEQICLAAPPRLYAHCDGARLEAPQDTERVGEVRRLIEAYSSKAGLPLYTRYRDKNMGLRKGVYEALNWFFENEEEGIVLEDDCVPDQTLFPFCSVLLDKYRHQDQIMHIGCSNLLAEKDKPTDSSYFFSRFSLVWGWASWRRAWQKIKIDLDGLEEFERNGSMERFLPNHMTREYMLDKFQGTRAGKNNSWAYAWFYSILKNNGLCIVSAANLVQNVGIGAEEATHTRATNKRAQLRAQAINFPLVHPKQYEPDMRLEMQLFYATQKKRYRLLLWYILQKIGLK